MILKFVIRVKLLTIKAISLLQLESRESYICLTSTLNSSHFRLDGCQTTKQAASTLLRLKLLKNEANLENWHNTENKYWKLKELGYSEFLHFSLLFWSKRMTYLYVNYCVRRTKKVPGINKTNFVKGLEHQNGF